MKESLQMMVFLDYPMEIQFVDDFELIELLRIMHKATKWSESKEELFETESKDLIVFFTGQFFCFFLQCSID